MLGVDLLVGIAPRDFLRFLEGFLRFDRQFFQIHVEKLLPSFQPCQPRLPASQGAAPSL